MSESGNEIEEKSEIEEVNNSDYKKDPINIDPNSVVDKEIVNNLVISSKEKGYKKGYEAALNEIKEKQKILSETNENITPVTEHTQHSIIEEEKIRNILNEELRKKQEEERKEAEKKHLEESARSLLNNLHTKVEEAKARYPDFDEVTSVLNVQEIPEILTYANEVDNAGDVLYDLAKNASKIATLRSLPPALAVAEVKKLSNSIKNNSNVGNVASVAPPLDEVVTSNIGTGDGTMSLRDLKRKYTA